MDITNGKINCGVGGYVDPQYTNQQEYEEYKGYIFCQTTQVKDIPYPYRPTK